MRLGQGSSIFLWTNGLTPVSGSALGAPGKKAEKVGSEAAKKFYIIYHVDLQLTNIWVIN